MKPNLPDPTMPPAYGWVLATLSLSMVMPSLDTSIANVGLPTLARAFSAPFHAVQWIVLAYLLAVTTLIVSAGRLGDLIGRRRLLMIGIGVFTSASLLCGLAPNLGLLIAARAIQGLGAAIMMALTLALVGETVPKAKTGSAIGLLGTMSAIGTALGPSLGGLLIARFGWPTIFLINVPLGIVNLWLAWHHLPAPAPKTATAKGFDIPGTVLLGSSLAAYALAVTAGDGHLGGTNLVLLVAAILGTGLFILVESRAASPLIRLAAFRDTVLSSGLGMNTVVATVMMATLVVGPFYLSRALGLGPAEVGMVMSVGPILSALSGILAGRVVDRLGAPRMVILGLATMAIGATALTTLPAVYGVAGYIIAIAILTPGYQMFQAANSTAIMMNVSSDQRGVISGMLSLSRNLGLITGASVMGAIFATASGTREITAAPPTAIAGGMQITFTVAAAMIVVALVGAIVRCGRKDLVESL